MSKLGELIGSPSPLLDLEFQLQRDISNKNTDEAIHPDLISLVSRVLTLLPSQLRIYI